MNKTTLPSIPPKHYFTIGETSQLCQIKPHVLRYWEQEFSQLKPIKRRGNRRYYRHKDIELIRKIRQLLYFQGYTINGAKRKLSNNFNVADNMIKIDNKAQNTTAVVNNLLEQLENLLIEIEKA